MRFFSFQTLALSLFFWSILIMFLAFSPKIALDDGAGFNHGLFAHMAAYSVWTGLAYFLLLMRLKKGVFFYSFMASCFFSSFVEAVQVLLPYRSGNLEDVVVNLVAAVLGCVIVWSSVNVSQFLNFHFCRSND